MSNTLQRITRANITLAQAAPFCMLSGVLAALQHRVVSDIPTAATDGINVMWSEEWASNLTPKELAFVVAHEAGHSFFLHNKTTTRMRELHPRLIPIAVDQVVNNFLVDCDPDGVYITMPKGGILDRKYQNMDVFEVLQDLLKNPPQNLQGFDQHDFVELSEQEQQDLVEAIEQGKRYAAAKGGNRNYVSAPPPQKNYADLLSQWLYSGMGRGATQANWKSPNRRLLHRGIYLPSRKGKALRCGVLTVDTSGSMSDEELGRAISTMKAIVSQVGGEELHVIYWDTSVTAHETYRFADARKLEATHPKGGGGTAFSPVLAYMKQHNIKPDVMVTITDGYVGDWGNKPDFPALWLMTTPVTAPWGETLRI